MKASSLIRNGARAFDEPLTDRGRSTAVRILEESKDILVAEGFAGLTFRNISSRSGITVGNVGYYYRTKDDLMVDLANYIFDRWEDRFRRDVSVSRSYDRKSFRLGLKYMIDQNKNPKTRALLMEMWSMSNRSAAVSKMMTAFYKRMRDTIEKMIRDVNPRMKDELVRLRAALITTQIEGLMLIIGPRGPKDRKIQGIEREALDQFERLAFPRGLAA